eukprot:UN30711
MIKFEAGMGLLCGVDAKIQGYCAGEMLSAVISDDTCLHTCYVEPFTDECDLDYLLVNGFEYGSCLERGFTQWLDTEPNDVPLDGTSMEHISGTCGKDSWRALTNQEPFRESRCANHTYPTGYTDSLDTDITCVNHGRLYQDTSCGIRCDRSMGYYRLYETQETISCLGTILKVRNQS